MVKASQASVDVLCHKNQINKQSSPPSLVHSGVKDDMVIEEDGGSVGEAVGATSASTLTTSLNAASISVFSAFSVAFLAFSSPSSSVTATLFVLK